MPRTGTQAAAPPRSRRAAKLRKASPSGQESRRDEILRVAASVFARQGVFNTTVRDIADEVGILSGSLYHHFVSKDQMLEDIIKPALDDDIKRYHEIAQSDLEAEEAVHQLLTVALRMIEEKRDVALIIANSYHQLRQDPRFEFLVEDNLMICRAWLSVLRRGVKSGTFRPDLDVDLAYRAMMGSVSSAAQWYDPSGSLSLEHIAREFASLYVHGFRGDEGSS